MFFRLFNSLENNRKHCDYFSFESNFTFTDDKNAKLVYTYYGSEKRSGTIGWILK